MLHRTTGLRPTAPAPALALAALLGLAGAPPVLAQGPADGHWEGAVEVPGQPLEIEVDLETAEDGALTGTISIPAQGLKDRELTDLSIGSDDGATTVRFAIPGIPGDPAFEGTLSEDGSTLAGTFRQGGAELPFELTSGADAATEARAALEGFGELAARAVDDFEVPGLAIAVVAGGETVYAQGFGHRDLEGELPMTPDTLFAVGSTTKAMTATVLGMLVDDGALDWDEPATRYLPELRLSDPMVTARITPRDLVTHRSGLPRHDLLWYNENDTTRQEMVARLAHLELTADLRERFQYNNLMYMTAGHLAGRLSGGTWEEVMRERLFDPLGMERTNFSVAASQENPDHALPYHETDDDALERIPFRPLDLIGPAGSVNSSVREMSRWLRFNLAGGEWDGRRLVQPETLSDLHSPHMTLPGRPSPESRVSQQAYGMGWMVEVYRGHRRVLHGGGIDGFTTAVVLFPDDDLGIVAFSNRGSPVPNLLAQHAADRILGLEPVDWVGDALERAEAGEADAEEAEERKETLRVADTAPSHPLEDYPGVYEHPGYGRLTIEEGQDGGEGERGLTMTFNGITAPLEHWHYDVWNGAETDGDPTFEDMKIQFRSDLEGQVTEVVAPFEPAASAVEFTKRPDDRFSDPEYLEGFVGTYVGATGQQSRVERSGETLILHVQGQPAYTLEPQPSGRFAIQGLTGFSVGFEEEDGRVTTLVFYQPNGVFEAERVEE
ncbi:MAG: serine hydrolase [bacterium]